MTRKRKEKKNCWWVFAKRALIMLFVLFLAASLMAAVGWEAISATGIVKEAFTALADAAADAFGGES
jgi:hypothetical protein